MDMHEHHHHDNAGGQDSGFRPGRIFFWGFLLIAGYFLLTEHLAHVITALPYLLLAACPLMHFFHHGGHGHGHEHGGADRAQEKAASAPPRQPDQR